MKVSVIIRTKNEEKTLGKLLESFKNQTFKDFETIIVDNESTDKTLDISKKYKIDKFISIPKGQFSHPKSTNAAIKEASGELIVLTNGHCVPFTNTWLEEGLKNFVDPEVAGIDGHYTTGYLATDWQKIEDEKYKPQMIKRKEGEWISTTNSIIRKDLWEKYPFDESLPECEDYDWSKEMISRGYKIIKDPKFNAYHLHPLTKEEYLKRKTTWDNLCSMIDERKRPYKQN